MQTGGNMNTSEIISGKDFTGGRYLELLAAAKEAQSRAYCPHSLFQVGCALVDENGQIHTGCNVENIAFTGTCSEAAAIANMIAHGGTIIKGLVCVSKDGITSCGDCRQRIWEFAGGDPELMCYFVDTSRDDEAQLITIGRLLPFAFKFDFNAR